ncbi:MAG: peptide chain release factor 2 [Syntrophales bacterium]|nr:peptide chain release factor 2 [Syntrophales bacterium]
MIEGWSETVSDLRRRIHHLGEYLDIPEKEIELKELESLTSKADFWEDPDKAREVLKKQSQIQENVDLWKLLQKRLSDMEALYEMAIEDNDEHTQEDLERDIAQLKTAVRDKELRMMLSAEQDHLNAIVSIHAGAGGTEAQDWAEMLLRMYLRWAERKGFKATIIDYQPGDEAGVKSVSLTVEGEYAYGYLKAEIGIHRLVRISPFDAGARRHTSFASVFVYPEVDDNIVIDINEDDLRFETYRSSGAGGQHVNKTDSAVRITHLPTGIVVQCQNERSQHKNKSMAMKYLKSRLYELRLAEQNEKSREVNKSKKDIAWGSQIRSYVLHPYRMIKDHRTNLEVGNVGPVLDGDIDDFIQAYLLN